VPRVPIQDDTKVRHRHIVPIDFVVMYVLFPGRIEVRDHLVAEEVEVHPFLAAAAFGTAEQLAVETTRGAKIVDRDRQMKGLWHRRQSIAWIATRRARVRRGRVDRQRSR
jgi:hypothetical protein